MSVFILLLYGHRQHTMLLVKECSTVQWQCVASSVRLRHYMHLPLLPQDTVQLV
jgi:hypothetical protein